MAADAPAPLCPPPFTRLFNHLISSSVLLCHAAVRVDITADQDGCTLLLCVHQHHCDDDWSLQLVNITFLVANEACCVLIEVLEQFDFL